MALGVLARTWGGPAHLAAVASRTGSAILGAVAAILVNNLPASVLLASQPPAHPGALLLGLNVGPNLAATGWLSALIWFRAAKAVGAAPRAARVSLLGAALVPLSLAAVGVASGLFSSAHF